MDIDNNNNNNNNNNIKTDDEYNEEFEIINKMFPNAKFNISIDISNFHDILTSSKEIIIKHSFNCYCYDNNAKTTQFYIIKGDIITNKYIIDELIKQNFELNCNHIFLEGFIKSINSECQFEIILGS